MENNFNNNQSGDDFDFNSFDSEGAKSAIEAEHINITTENPLEELFKIGISIVSILILVYFVIFESSGVIINHLPEDKRCFLEEILSKNVISGDNVEISEENSERIERIKNDILEADGDFPKTAKLEISVIDNKIYNAFCYPNGNIKITKPLFDELKTDEELTFIIAHEMGHYKHKDNLKQLRRNISNAITVIIFGIFSNSNDSLNKIATGGMEVTELSFSRTDEVMADEYAVEILKKLYGSAQGAIDAMNILAEKDKLNIELLSTHPNIEHRIENIKKFEEEK